MNEPRCECHACTRSRSLERVMDQLPYRTQDPRLVELEIAVQGLLAREADRETKQTFTTYPEMKDIAERVL